MKVVLLFKGPAARAQAIKTAQNWADGDDYYRSACGAGRVTYLVHQDNRHSVESVSFGARIRGGDGDNEAYAAEVVAALLAAGETLGWCTSSGNKTYLRFDPEGAVLTYEGRRSRCQVDFGDMDQGPGVKVLFYSTSTPDLAWSETMAEYIGKPNAKRGLVMSYLAKLKEWGRPRSLSSVPSLGEFSRVHGKTESWLSASFSGPDLATARTLARITTL